MKQKNLTKNSINMYPKISFFLIIFVILSVHQTFAISMTNNDFQIQDTQIQIGTSIPVQNQTHQSGYEVSFPEGKTPISVSIDSPIVDFGEVHPGEPILRSIHLGIASTLPTFSLLAEDHALESTVGATLIPDTTCDSGTCTSYIADDWENPLTYGFGYRCESSFHLCDPQFTDQNAYLQIPHENAHFTNVISTDTFNSASLDLSLQLNIANTSPIQRYTNTIFIISSPKI